MLLFPCNYHAMTWQWEYVMLFGLLLMFKKHKQTSMVDGNKLHELPKNCVKFPKHYIFYALITIFFFDVATRMKNIGNTTIADVYFFSLVLFGSFFLVTDSFVRYFVNKSTIFFFASLFALLRYPGRCCYSS